MARSSSSVRTDRVTSSARDDDGASFAAAQNVGVLNQALELIERLTAELYSGEPEWARRSSEVDASGSATKGQSKTSWGGAGSHLRHIHDYYRCFLRDVDSGRIDYDLRVRDARFEVDADHATSELTATIADLLAHAKAGAAAGAHLEVRMDADPDDPNGWTPSTVLRELRFLVSHTIHHYALIALILKAKGFDCGTEFGVAPSTLRHWSEQAQSD